MQNSSSRMSIRQRISDQELDIQSLESLNRNRIRTGSEPTGLDRLTKMRKDLSVLYSQEKALQHTAKRKQESSDQATYSRPINSNDLQAILGKAIRIGSWKGNESEPKKNYYLTELAVGIKRAREQELANQKRSGPQVAPNSVTILYNGKKKIVKRSEVPSKAAIDKKQLELFAKDSPKGYGTYMALLTKERGETDSTKRAELMVRRRNLLITGKDTGPAAGTSLDPGLLGNAWNGIERFVDMVDESINHPGERLRKAIKAGKIPNNALTRGAATFNDYYHPITGILGSPEDVQKAVGNISGLVTSKLTSGITYTTDIPRRYIETHMKQGRIRDAVGIASGATGLSKSGQILGLIPGAFDVPNWSVTKAVMAPKKYFDEGSALLDNDTLENRLLFGIHAAGPLGDLLGLGVNGVASNVTRKILVKGAGGILKKVAPEVVESQVTKHVANNAGHFWNELNLRDHTELPSGSSEQLSFRNTNLQRIEKLDRLRGKGVGNTRSRRRGSAKAITHLDVEWAARMGLEHAIRTKEPLFHSVQTISQAKGFTAKRFHEAAFELARKIHAGEKAPQGAYVTPDLLDEYRHGITSNRTGVLMADPASVNEIYFNPVTGARGTLKSGGGPGYANKVLDPRRHAQELAWAVMNGAAAKGVVNRVGPGNLLATYKAFSPDVVLGSHGYLAIEPEMRAAGMTFRDIKRVLSIAEKGRPKALDWKAVHAADDIRKIFDPRWSTFENRIKLYKLLFNGQRINGVHWRDVADLLESGHTKGYRPGDMMNILRINSDHLHPNGALHGTYDVGIRGSNEGLFPDKVNIRDFYRSAYNRGVGNSTRSLQLGGKYEPDARTIERIIRSGKDVRP